MLEPIRIAFLGCGFITAIHSRHLRALGRETVRSYASRDRAKAEEYRRRFGGAKAYADYASAIDDSSIDAVVVAVPPKFHLELTLQALERGKHVLVEKPAFPRMEDYRAAIAVRDASRHTVLVGENDHYKPLAATLRSMLAGGAIGELVLAHFVTIAKRLKEADDWRNDEDVAGGDAFFEEGIHWLHLANSLGPQIVAIHGYRPARPPPAANGSDRRAKTILVSFQYDNGAAGSLYYSREVPSLFRGLRLSKLFGRDGVITFESNGLFVYARGRLVPRLVCPGFRDIRGYRAMYRDFIRAIRTGVAPEMSLERAVEDQRLMDRLYAAIGQ